MKKNPNNIDEMYYELNQHIDLANNNISRSKNSFARNIEEFGDVYIADVNVKEHKKEITRQKKIKYIVKHSKDQFGDKDYLMNTPFEDIESIYIKVKELRKRWFQPFLDFIMGWDDDKQQHKYR